jgi:hypothetical protein
MNELGVLDRIERINRMGRQQGSGLRQTAVPRGLGNALQVLRELCILYGYFVPVYHQFYVLFGVSPVV